MVRNGDVPELLRCFEGKGRRRKKGNEDAGGSGTSPV